MKTIEISGEHKRVRHIERLECWVKGCKQLPVNRVYAEDGWNLVVCEKHTPKEE